MFWPKGPLAVVFLIIINEFFSPGLYRGLLSLVCISYNSQVSARLSFHTDKAEQQNLDCSGFPKAVVTLMSPLGLPTSCGNSMKEYLITYVAQSGGVPQMLVSIPKCFLQQLV